MSTPVEAGVVILAVAAVAVRHHRSADLGSRLGKGGDGSGLLLPEFDDN